MGNNLVVLILALLVIMEGLVILIDGDNSMECHRKLDSTITEWGRTIDSLESTTDSLNECIDMYKVEYNKICDTNKE